ncbi:hypothetical protein L360_05364, partial [Enterobacter sp. MGH 14]
MKPPDGQLRYRDTGKVLFSKE